MNLREIIRNRMAELGWTQLKLAEESGVYQSVISRYLAGERDMTGVKLGQVLDALGLTVTPSPRKVKREAKRKLKER